MSNLVVDNATVMSSLEVMEKAWKFASIISKSDIIPMHYRNKPENVFIAVQTACRMNLDPMMIMQNTYIVSGKLGMNSSFAISLANKSGLLEGGIRYRIEGEGNELRVTAYGTLKQTREEISFTIGMKEARAENWTKNSKYATLPELMLRYRAAILLIRTHMPEALNGMQTVEEMEDVKAANIIVSKSDSNIVSKTQALSDKLKEIEPIEMSVEGVENVKTEEPSIPVLHKHEELAKLIVEKEVSQATVDKWCEKAGVETIEELDEGKLLSCINYVNDKYADQRHL